MLPPSPLLCPACLLCPVLLAFLPLHAQASLPWSLTCLPGPGLSIFASFPFCLFLLFLQHRGAFLLLSLSPLSCLLIPNSPGLSLKGFICLTIPLTVLSLCPCVPRSLCVGGDGGCLWRRVYWLLHSSCRPVATATRSEGPHCYS